jgi:hypothetical protein
VLSTWLTGVAFFVPRIAAALLVLHPPERRAPGDPSPRRPFLPGIAASRPACVPRRAEAARGLPSAGTPPSASGAARSNRRAIRPSPEPPPGDRAAPANGAGQARTRGA